jgi:hypothetical protein
MPSAKAKLKSVTLGVQWGYAHHSIDISARNWSRIKRLLPVTLRGETYYYEGARFNCYWDFNGRGKPGSLIVGYGNDGAEGYVGTWTGLKAEENYEALSTPTAPQPAFANLAEARQAFPDPAAFRAALVDDAHSSGGRFDKIEAIDLLKACGVEAGEMNEFCIKQVPTDRAAFRRGDDFGWGFRYTYRIPGNKRRGVRFVTEHGDGGRLESCDGPYACRIPGPKRSKES